jgi:peroxiredoxin
MLQQGERATDFTLPDTKDQPHRLTEALAAGPVVLAFMKVGCGACNLTFPYLENLRRAYPGDRWQLWGISQDPAQPTQSFASQYGVTFPMLIDAGELAISRAYDPQATPTMFLVDPSGQVQSTSIGHSKDDLNALSARLATALGAVPVIVAPPGDGQPDTRPG